MAGDARYGHGVDVTFDLLAGMVGEDLEFAAVEGAAISLRIAAVEPNPVGAQGGSIELVGPRRPALTQGTFPIRHPEHGDGVLFIVPIDEDDQTRTYQAVFG